MDNISQNVLLAALFKANGLPICVPAKTISGNEIQLSRNTLFYSIDINTATELKLDWSLIPIDDSGVIYLLVDLPAVVSFSICNIYWATAQSFSEAGIYLIRVDFSPSYRAASTIAFIPAATLPVLVDATSGNIDSLMNGVYPGGVLRLTAGEYQASSASAVNLAQDITIEGADIDETVLSATIATGIKKLSLANLTLSKTSLSLSDTSATYSDMVTAGGDITYSGAAIQINTVETNITAGTYGVLNCGCRVVRGKARIETCTITVGGSTTLTDKIYCGGMGNNVGTVTAQIGVSFASHLYGGTFGGVVSGNVVLELNGGAELTGRVYAGGAGSVLNQNSAQYATSVKIAASTNYKACVYLGSFSDAAMMEPKIIMGDVSALVEDTATVGTLIFGGNFNNNSGNTDTITGKSVITAGSCAINNYIYGGGYAVGNATVITAKGTSIVLNGTAIVSAGVIYGGGRANGASSLAIIGTEGDPTTGSRISLTNTTGGSVYGGGFAAGNGRSIVYGGSYISVNGSSIKNIFGGGSIGDTNARTESAVYGGSHITIGTGTITGNIYGGGQAVNSAVYGGSNITFTDATLSFSGTVNGDGNAAVAPFEGLRTLNFAAGFSGDFNGSIFRFDAISIASAGQVKFTKSQALSGVVHWDFDLTNRSAEQAATALLDWATGSNDFAGKRIDLRLPDNASVSSWVILHTGSTLLAGWNSANWFINGIDFASATAAGGPFAGWQLETIASVNGGENDTLKIKKLSDEG